MLAVIFESECNCGLSAKHKQSSTFLLTTQVGMSCIDVMPKLLLNHCRFNHFQLCEHICHVQQSFLLVLNINIMRACFCVPSSLPLLSK
jgi:hypothetical protein